MKSVKHSLRFLTFPLFSIHREIEPFSSEKLPDCIDEQRCSSECQMQRYDIAKEFYLNEEKLRESLPGRLTSSLGLIAVAGGFLSFFIQDIFKWISVIKRTGFESDWVSICYVSFAVLSAIVLAVAVFRFLRALSGHHYHALANIEDILKYHEGLEKHYKKSEVVKDELRKWMTGDYAKVTALNETIRLSRQINLEKFMEWFGLCLFMLGGTFVFYILSALNLNGSKSDFFAKANLSEVPIEIAAEKVPVP